MPLLKIAPHMKRLLWEVPVNPSSGRLRDLKRLAGFVWRFRKIGPQFYDIYNLLTMSAYDYLSRWFSSDDVKLVLGFFAGGGGANSSLKTPGSAYMLARGLVRDGSTAAGPGGFMKGGMGSISDSIRRSGEAYGMEVRTSCPVAKILNDKGRAVGVRLEGGEEIRSKIVIANATARTIFTRLLDTVTLPEEFNRDIRNIRCESTVFRVNLALSSLPEAQVFGQTSPDGGAVPQIDHRAECRLYGTCLASGPGRRYGGGAFHGRQSPLDGGSDTGARRPSHHEYLRRPRAL